MLVPIGGPFDDRKLRSAFGPLLKRQDAQHDEGTVEKQDEQTDIDGEDRFEDLGFHRLNLPLQIDDAQKARHHDAQQDGEDHPHDRGHGPFQRSDLGHDDIAQKVHLSSGQRTRCREFPKHHHADEDGPDHDAGQAERKDDLPEDAPKPCAKVAGRLDDVAVDPTQHKGDGPHHEDDIDLRHADDDRQLGKQQHLDRRVDKPDFLQDDVDRPFLAQHGAPGQHPDQERGPERDDAQHQKDRRDRLAFHQQAHIKRGGIPDDEGQRENDQP
mmetsp:Transcript_4037/g.6587  ORF Transcript_4037/g.6587 Transcript_4037/m.6587 type:complete len:270 (+) Transcript_4037:392-1201(+)